MADIQTVLQPLANLILNALVQKESCLPPIYRFLILYLHILVLDVCRTLVN